jgi:hypothetical protein
LYGRSALHPCRLPLTQTSPAPPPPRR